MFTQERTTVTTDIGSILYMYEEDLAALCTRTSDFAAHADKRAYDHHTNCTVCRRCILMFTQQELIYFEVLRTWYQVPGTRYQVPGN